MRQQIYKPAALQLVPYMWQTDLLRFEGSEERPMESDLHNVDCGYYNCIAGLFYYRDAYHTSNKSTEVMTLYMNSGVRIHKKNNTIVIMAPDF